MKWFRVLPMAIACVAAFILFVLAAHDHRSVLAATCALITVGSGIIVYDGLKK